MLTKEDDVGLHKAVAFGAAAWVGGINGRSHSLLGHLGLTINAVSSLKVACKHLEGGLWQEAKEGDRDCSGDIQNQCHTLLPFEEREISWLILCV